MAKFVKFFLFAVLALSAVSLAAVHVHQQL